jgi:hypothetical protein
MPSVGTFAYPMLCHCSHSDPSSQRAISLWQSPLFGPAQKPMLTICTIREGKAEQGAAPNSSGGGVDIVFMALFRPPHCLLGVAYVGAKL